MKLSKGWLAAIVIMLVLILDQAVKIWVKTHMYLGESYAITSWFQIYFVENNGMAFGMELGSKLFLSLFRIIAVGVLIWVIRWLSRRPETKTGFLVCVALITAGAAGNIFDSVLYGMIFNNPLPPAVAEFMSAEGGYAPIFYGKVVDMLYFPLFSFYWPDWIPFIGGDYFLFFQPIFNIADSAITVGMIILILFYSKYIALPHHEPDAESADNKH